MIVLGTLLTEHIYLLTVVYCCVASTTGLCVAKQKNLMFPIVKYCVAQIIIVVAIEIKTFIFWLALYVDQNTCAQLQYLTYDTLDPKSNCSFPISFMYYKKSKSYMNH